MKNIRFCREYMAPPFFCQDIGEMGHVEIDDLKISDELKMEIHEWNDLFQSTFVSEYPPDSTFASKEMDKRHERDGYILAERLQMELGCDYNVIVDF